MPTFGQLKFDFLPTPYTDANIKRPGIVAKRQRTKKYRTHGIMIKDAKEVSDVLETKYDIVHFFHEKYKDQINELVAAAIEDKLISSKRLRDTNFKNLAKEAFPKIESMFRKFLDRREMDGFVPGVPTYASLIGRSVRGIKHDNPGRPSFIDTGIYRASFYVSAA